MNLYGPGLGCYRFLCIWVPFLYNSIYKSPISIHFIDLDPISIDPINPEAISVGCYKPESLFCGDFMGVQDSLWNFLSVHEESDFPVKNMSVGHRNMGVAKKSGNPAATAPPAPCCGSLREPRGDYRNQMKNNGPFLASPTNQPKMKKSKNGKHDKMIKMKNN